MSISAEDYHADKLLPEPSLSASIAALICNESPKHAWTAHPRLNPNHARDFSEAMDLGSICHALLLEGSTEKVHLIQARKTEGTGKNKVITDIPVDDWRSGAARVERDEARTCGKFPILQCDWPAVEAMYAAAQAQLKAMKIDLSLGEPEHTITWFEEEFDIWCRARLDWVSKDRLNILDYKSTGATANPEVVSRTLFTNGYDIQEAFYRRGVKVVYGTDARFRFLYQETHAPHAMSAIALDPMSQMYADKQMRFAMETFGGCLRSGVWPAYPTQTCYAELPVWLEKRQEERELNGLHV